MLTGTACGTLPPRTPGGAISQATLSRAPALQGSGCRRVHNPVGGRAATPMAQALRRTLSHSRSRHLVRAATPDPIRSTVGGGPQTAFLYRPTHDQGKGGVGSWGQVPSGHGAWRDPGLHCFVLGLRDGAQRPECLDRICAGDAWRGTWGRIKVDHLGSTTIVIS